MKYCLFLVILFFSACSGNYEVMTRNSYADIEVGMPSSELEKRFGKPYNIRSEGNKNDTYEYIEKISMGRNIIEQRRYYIVIEKGKVVGKYMKYSRPPSFKAIYSDDPYPNY